MTLYSTDLSTSSPGPSAAHVIPANSSNCECDRSRDRDEEAVAYGRIFLYAAVFQRRRRITSRLESTSTFSTFSAACFVADVTTR